MSINSLITFITPHNCSICGFEGELICDKCSFDGLKPTHSTCYKCNKLTKNFSTCRSCRSSSNLKSVFAVSLYEDLAKELINQYKFKQNRSLSKTIANLMQNDSNKFNFDLITYVPTAPRRIRQRGFDHAKLLAKEIARQNNIKLSVLLSRTNQNRQVGSSRAERIRNMKDSFRYRSSANYIENKRILLVDDVVSTGATAEAAASILKENGAKSISLTVLAKNLNA